MQENLNGQSSNSEEVRTAYFTETPAGVDPNDPEEIARKEHYLNLDGFEKILDINNRKISNKIVTFRSFKTSNEL